jgi:hypothetical protein
MHFDEVQGHLDCVEMKDIRSSDVHHPEKNKRVHFPAKTEVSDLSGAPGFHHSLDCTAREKIRSGSSNRMTSLS